MSTAAAASPGPAPLDPVPLVEVTRRDVRTGDEIVESVHHGHLVHVTVTDAADDGTQVLGLGDAHAAVFPRSAVKPFQAAACIELLAGAGGEAAEVAAGLTDEEVAVGWASHRAEPAQLDAVRSLLARGGLDESALTCPRADVPDDPAAPRSRLAHNCSGKHALFAVTARLLGLDGGLDGDPESVLAADGPLQPRLLARVAELIGPIGAVGVDGCGAPAIVVPLSALATSFARLAVDDTAALARVRDAGLAHPLLVGGSERRAGGMRVPLVDSALLGAGVVAKRGAEGVLAAGWRDGDGRGHGVAVKALDGSLRGASTALVALLAAEGAVAADVWAEAAPRGGSQKSGTVRAVPKVHGMDGVLGPR